MERRGKQYAISRPMSWRCKLRTGYVVVLAQILLISALVSGGLTACSDKEDESEDIQGPPLGTGMSSLNLTNPVIGQVIGSDGLNYNPGSKMPDGVNKVAMIAYLAHENDTICSKGLAIALSDDNSGNWSSAVNTAAVHSPAFSNGTWRLPSTSEWQCMFLGCGSTGTSFRNELYMMNKLNFNCEGFKTMLSAAGGEPMASARYWSRTHTSYSAWNYSFETGMFYSSLPSFEYRVRVVLAF